MKQILKNDVVVEVLAGAINSGTISTKINAIGREDREDAFFVGDLGDIVHKYKLFLQELPRVHPHYAVKCNDDPAVLAVLAALGTGFDCASKAEIQKILNLKVSPSDIIYANPCKQTSHIKFAAKHDVPLMTFDNETELHKVKVIYPDAKLVLRILPPDDDKAECQFGMKFGCHSKDVRHLFKVAKELELNVVGVSFHVGSGCFDSGAFASAITASRQAFNIGEEEGFDMKLLDIGGGFPGTPNAKVTFQEIAAVLRQSLDEHFPEDCGVRIIAEPGRFFVASAFTLAVNIIAKRTVTNTDEAVSLTTKSFMYYVNDGVYGSFNCILFDHAKVEPSLLKEKIDLPLYNSSVWGPTCDGLDCINDTCLLPELQQGDWIIFKNMGAYTMSAASNFNGMPKPPAYYVAHEEEWLTVRDQLPTVGEDKDSCTFEKTTTTPLIPTTKSLPSKSKWVGHDADTGLTVVSDRFMDHVPTMLESYTLSDM